MFESAGVEVNGNNFITSYIPPPIFLPSVNHLLDMNREPSEQERVAIKRAGMRAKHRLCRYDKSIKQVTAELDRLVTERDALLQLRIRHLAVIAPIRRCPPEILSDIFIQCLPASAHHKDNWKTPLALSHVNRQWRNVAICITPQLWSQIYVCQKSPDFCPAWIERSGKSPLSIDVDGLEYDYRDDRSLGCNHCDGQVHHMDKNFPEVVQSLVESSPRWEKASLRSLVMQYLHPIENSIPSLQCLKFEGHLFDGPQTSRLFKNAPRLRSVEILYNHADDDMHLALPCLQIKRFASHDASVTSALSHISHMRNLATYIGRGVVMSSTAENGKLIHNNLRTLFLQTEGPVETGLAGELWRRLTLPGLKNLWVDGRRCIGSGGDCWQWTSEVHQDFTNLLYRSSCHLHTLCLVNVHFAANFNVDYCLEILRLVPNIVDLHFGSTVKTATNTSHLRGHILELLATDGSERNHAPACPTVQNITLYGCFPTGAMASLTDIARLRGTHGSNVKAIKTMTFNIPSDTTQATISRLRSLESISAHPLEIYIDHNMKSLSPPGDWDDPQEDEC